MELLVALACLAADLGILYYVKREYEESRELNQRLARVLKMTRRKRISATQLVKAVVAQEAPVGQ